MKSISKNKHLVTKCLFFICLLMVSFSGFSQKKSVIQDPQLGKLEFSDITGNQVDENYIQPLQVLKLKLPVGLVSHGKALPAGSCKIKIGFGSKLVLDPSYDLNSTTLGNYFKWTATTSGGQTQVTGELVNSIPESFQTTDVAFKVMGATEGNSTITANFLLTNHNTNTILSDEDGTNNISFIHYRITSLTAPVPVTTINDLAKGNCTMNVSFSTDKEINLSKYEVEVSKDASNYVKVAEVAASNLSVYTLNVNITQDIQARVLYVRIKTIDRNGRAVYSNAKTMDATCQGKWQLDIFPNPAVDVRSVVIRSVEGSFDGKYLISMVDMAGKKVSVKEIQLNSVTSFSYDFGKLASGKYFIKVTSADGSQTALLNFEKL